MGRSIGIDLGTTNSVVAYVLQDKVETIVNTEGNRTTPSVVLFGGEEIIVGELAKRQAVMQHGQVVRSAKRLMGRRYSEVESYQEDFPFRVREGEEDRAEILLEDGRCIPPEVVSAHVLIKIKETAEEFLGEDVSTAVITVPAHFNDAQRTATKRAAEMAGLSVLRIINEPTAAALAYGLGTGGQRQTIAVFDFGGGTFDISILQIDRDIFEVLSTNGDTHLGGDDIDHAVAERICDAVKESTGIDPREDRQALARIHEVAEKVKIELSSLKSTRVSLPFVVSDESGPKHYEGDVTREQFNEWAEPFFQRLLEPCRMALKDAHLKVENLDAVLLVGGSTRIPRVQELVTDFFKRTPDRSINPDEAVAMGAAIQGGVMRGELAEILLLDVTPLSLGIELAGGVFKSLIDRNSSVPCEATRKFTTVVDNQTSVSVHVLQGERAKASENRTLARFRLTGIPPMPKDLPEIEVKFRIDADGILEVSAIDFTSGVSAGVQVEGYGDLAAMSQEEVERLLEEVKAHSKEDEEFLRSASRRTQAQRVQARVTQLLEVAGDIVEEPDLKQFKETMFRHDLAVANQEWKLVDRHETILKDLLDKYEGMEAAFRALGKHFDFESHHLDSFSPVEASRKHEGTVTPVPDVARAEPVPPPPEADEEREEPVDESGDPEMPPPPPVAAPPPPRSMHPFAPRKPGSFASKARPVPAAADNSAGEQDEDSRREPAREPSLPPAGGAPPRNPFAGDDEYAEDDDLPPPPPPPA